MADPLPAWRTPSLFSNPLDVPASAASKPKAKVVKARKPAKKPSATPNALNTPSVRPAQVSTVKRFVPHRKDEPIAGFTSGIRNPDGTWAVPGGKHVPGGTLAERPYYTDAYTTHHGAGPSGDDSTQLNSADTARAAKIQMENYGKPGYIFRSAIPGGLNENPGSTAAAAGRAANIGSMLLPGGGVGEAAGLLGFGLKALRGARAGKKVVEAASPVRSVPISSIVKSHPLDQPHHEAGIKRAMGELKAGKSYPITIDETGRVIDGNQRLEAAKRLGRTHIDVIYDTPAGVAPEAAHEFLLPRELSAQARVYGAAAGGERSKLTVTPARGKVGGPGTPAVLPTKGVVEPASASVVRGAMPGAKILRGKQEAGYSIERSKRVSAANVHLSNPSLAPADRVALAKGELRGELPKIDFQGFKELNNDSLHALQTYILDHPHLTPFQKIRTSDSLVNALAGKVPTKSEIILLEHVFGKNTAAGLNSLATNPLRDKIVSVLNIPRSLMASFDLSAPFRQGLMVSTRHPALFARNFGPMVKAFGSEKVYHATIDEIRSRPTYPLMLEAKLPITELAGDVGAREEQFASDYAEKLTGGKYSPVRASGRAYTGFLDKTRADVFDHLIKRAQAQGIDVQDPKFLKSLGSYIGSATGRGDLGSFQEAGKVLNAFFFSPRLLASRLNFLNPAYYARLDPFARKEALRSAVQLAGTLSVMLGLASRIPGVSVKTDPRSSDWGKIRIGNTRVDIAGGFQQELRLAAQLATGVAISSTSGKRMSLKAGGFGNPTRLDFALRFFIGKESPIASLVTDWARGSTMVGQKFTWQSAATQRMIPLLAQDSYDLYKERDGGLDGLAAAFAGYGIGGFGLGMQTYGPAKPDAPQLPPGYGGSSSRPSWRSAPGGLTSEATKP